ncbi:MAG TPA: sulfotransferase, partial [Thermoanaerobaculia bacterium]|nr:sulfotransferase [Thermoanaerobaculia bacterium]
RLVGLDGAPPFDGRETDLGTNHTTGGNRNRWQSGPVAIRADRKWRKGLRASDVRLISATTWPYRLRHGYHP